jgi:predicted nuclease of predicted toxin-antitoxin system
VRFLLDHCIPASVANVLTERGHTCIFLAEVLPPDAPDIVVARAAEINDCVLITQDADFKQFIGKVPSGAKGGLRKLSRISLQCESFNCAKRILLAMSFIELEWSICQSSSDKRMFIHVGRNTMRTTR